MKDPVRPPLPNIILIGLMGCGKTTIGKELHRETNLRFTDTDQLIEQQTGMSIPQIFKIHGESHFRDLETGVLRQMQSGSRHSRIISTGGGITIRPENRKLLKELGFVVWLHTDVNTLYQRISRCSNRPLLQAPDPRGVLARLMDERLPFYQETAHLTIDTANLHIHEITLNPPGCSVHADTAAYSFSVSCFPQGLSVLLQETTKGDPHRRNAFRES